MKKVIQERLFSFRNVIFAMDDADQDEKYVYSVPNKLDRDHTEISHRCDTLRNLITKKDNLNSNLD